MGNRGLQWGTEGYNGEPRAKGLDGKKRILDMMTQIV